MNKKLWIAFIVTFIAWNVLNFIIHGVLLGSAYSSEEMMKIWRPDMEQKMWIFYLVTFIQSFFLVMLYSKWYKKGGAGEGLQFGTYTGFLLATPMAYSSYAMYPIPYSITLGWFIYGLIVFLILGLLIALVFGKKEPGHSAL